MKDKTTWQKINRKRLRFEAIYIPRMQTALDKQFKPFLDSLQGAQSLEHIQSIADLITFNDSDIRPIFENLYSDVGNYFARDLYSQLFPRKNIHIQPIRTKQELPIFTERLLGYVYTIAGELITLITGYTKDAIIEAVRQTLTIATAEGWGVTKAVDDLTKRLDKFTRYRAERIVRTEIMRASNIGADMAAQDAKASGVNLTKRWISTFDNRTRDTHRAVNGQERDMDGLFDVGGTQMKYPGDIAGGARETINCRCVVTYRERI